VGVKEVNLQRHLTAKLFIAWQQLIHKLLLTWCSVFSKNCEQTHLKRSRGAFSSPCKISSLKSSRICEPIRIPSLTFASLNRGNFPLKYLQAVLVQQLFLTWCKFRALLLPTCVKWKLELIFNFLFSIRYQHHSFDKN
jgi:hypothetical protein